ncbi:MAG: DHH family phosphoesterase [Planctomycetota bacterium]|jgi:phosphoesterase RecJ-like protein
MTVPAELVEAVRAARSIVCATHNPMDGDGLGCGLALRRVLTAAGKQCLFVTETPPPRAYRFLPGYDDIAQLGKGAPPPCELLIGLDAGEPDRLGRLYAERAPETKAANIDHHVSNSRFGDLVWVEPGAAATGEQVYLLLRALGYELDPVSAQCLLVSIVTDTGRFCYAATSPRTFEIAAALLRAGADPDGLQRHLYGAMPRPVLELRSRAVEALAFHAGGRLAVLAVPSDFGADLGLDAEEVKDLVDLAIGVEGVIVAALVRGLPEGGCKVSLRSKDDRADVAAFSVQRGGGGHVRAAGFSSDRDPAGTVAEIRAGLEALVVAAAE